MAGIVCNTCRDMHDDFFKEGIKDTCYYTTKNVKGEDQRAIVLKCHKKLFHIVYVSAKNENILFCL